jgi:hypothetical protein
MEPNPKLSTFAFICPKGLDGALKDGATLDMSASEGILKEGSEKETLSNALGLEGLIP